MALGWLRVGAVLAAGAVAWPALAGSGDGAAVRAAGSGAGIGVVRLLAERFGAAHPGVAVVVPESVGTSGAVRGLAAGKVDLGILARPLKPGEVDGARSLVVCRTPLVFFTSRQRGDVALSRRDLPALFTGTLAPFGGGEVRPLLRPASDGSTLGLLEYFPELASAVEAARGMRGVNLALTDQDAMDAVEASGSLVGFGAYAPLPAEGRRLVAVPLDGVTPGVEALETGRYPYAAPIVLALPADPAPGARAFVDFALSPAAAPVLRANGCLPAGGDR
jgi:phosphate transport system substrate-binding protein